MESAENISEPIVVVGAGIIGLTTAYKLAKAGHTSITVLEKFSHGGQFCSHGNAGLIRGHKAWELKYSPKNDKQSVLHAVFHSFLNHLPFFNTLNEFDSNFTIDPRFFLSPSSYHWGLLHFKKKLDRFLSKQLIKNSNGSQWNTLKTEWTEYCFNHANNIFGEEKHDSLINKYIDKYNYPIGVSHYNVIYDMYKKNTSSSDNEQAFNVLQNANVCNVNTTDIDGKSFGKNCDQESFVPYDKDFLRLKWDNDENSRIETNPASIVANCGQFCKLLTSACQELGVKFHFNTELIKIIVNDCDDNSGITKKKKKKKIKAIYTSNEELIECNKLILSSGIMTNDIIKNRIFNSIEDIKPVKNLPFIPIVPLQGFSITLKLNDYDYKYESSANVFYPTHMYMSKFGDDCLRFAKFGYLRPMRYANKKWQNWDDSVGNSKDSNSISSVNNSIFDAGYIRSCIGETEMQYFEKKLTNLLIDGIEKYYLPLFNIDENEWQNNRKFWTNWRPLTPDDNPIVSIVDEIDGLYINGNFKLVIYCLVLFVTPLYDLFVFVVNYLLANCDWFFFYCLWF